MATSMFERDDLRAARLHLQAVFGAKDDALSIVVFELNPARSTSFTDIDAAATYAAGKPDVYVHVGLAPHPFTGGDRPTAREVAAIAALVADLDIAGPGHKKPGLPPSEAEARRILDAIGLPPGLVIHSGGGLQVWWPFAEPWTFDDDAERRRAQILCRAFAITIRERARGLGYAVDMVGDLARVLRVAGTVNAKTPERRPVRIVSQTGATIGEDDILAVLLDGSWEQAEREIDGRSRADTANCGDLILDPAAEPPWDKLDALRDLEPRCDASWRRKRLAHSATWTASEWDQSLAAYAAQAGWSRQEIANLLIASRRKHGDDLKLRQDYYRLTIDKATAGREEAEAVREAVAAVTDVAAASAGTDEGPTDAQRSDVLAKISRAIGVEITRVTRSRSDPPVFGIETPYGSGEIGGVGNIVNNRRFREKVAELTSRIPRAFKTELWDPHAGGLLQVAELVDLGIETTLAGKAETLVSLYLGHQPRQVWAEMSDKARAVLPIRLEPYTDDDGAVRIFASGFRSWLAEHQHEPMSRTEIATLLRAYGATSETRHYGGGKTRTTRSVWRLPPRPQTPEVDG